MSLGGNEKKCAVCGKKFFITEQWVYKKSYGKADKVFCSWKCLREMERKKLTPSQRREMIQSELLKGLSVKEVSNKLHEDSAKVWYWAKKLGVIGCANSAQTRNTGED